jgi:hypothetical protein
MFLRAEAGQWRPHGDSFETVTAAFISAERLTLT